MEHASTARSRGATGAGRRFEQRCAVPERSQTFHAVALFLVALAAGA